MVVLAPDHRQAAEDIEADVATLYLPPRASRLAIKGCWGAAFHWIAFGCETKHAQHREPHIRLGAFSRNNVAEPSVADWWEELEWLRQGGWYGGHFDPNSVQRAFTVLGEVRSWATS